MKVSLCLIVRDEEENLDACIASVQGLMDEVVIVDTGSSDRTPEFAKARADVYDEIEWEGFAHARNHAQGLASGDAIFVLDADERVLNPDGWEKAKEELERGADGIAVVVENELPQGQILVADRLWQVRMYMNSPTARWSGRVHNQITGVLKENPRDGVKAKFVQVPIQIGHKGYNLGPERMKMKYRARLEDLLKEVETAVDPAIKAYYQFQASNAYFMLGEKLTSLEWAKECEVELLTKENKYSLALMAVHTSHVAKDKEGALGWAKLMMDTFPGEAMSFLMLGLALLGEDAKGAYNFLGSTLALCQLQGMGGKYSLDAHYIAGAAGEAALALQRYGEAKELFQMFLSKHQSDRVKQLEAAIIPMEEARQRGLVKEEKEELDQDLLVELRSESSEIPDLRRTG